MHRWLWVLLVGCSYTTPEGSPNDGEEPPTPPGVDAGTPGVACREPGTVLCLDFEVDVDPMIRATDASGFAHDAVARNVELRSTDVATAAVDTRSALFDGISSELRIAASPKLDLTGPFTLEAWVVRKFNVISGHEYFVVDSSGQFSMSIQDSNALRCAVATGNGERDVSTRDVPVGDDRWHHIACTWDPDKGGTIRAYIDGAVDDCDTGTGPIVELAGATTVGARTNGGASEHFFGFLDNVHVYDRALTPGELCAIAGQSGCESRCPNGNGGGFGIDVDL